MHTNEGWPDTLSCRLKTARQKKRLQKKDFEKQLIQLDKKRTELWHRRHKMPWITLKEPYQKGWKRFFVLREDIKRSAGAAFYETLLEKINTVKYSGNKGFKRKKRRKTGNVYVVEKQTLKEFSLPELNSPKTGLTEKERSMFYLKITWNVYEKRWTGKYAFKEPWRYVLKTRPHIITETRMRDDTLEQEYQQLENRIERNYWNRKIYRLTKGRNQYGRFGPIRIITPRKQFNNNALQVLLDLCREESIIQTP